MSVLKIVDLIKNTLIEVKLFCLLSDVPVQKREIVKIRY
jgi:hypothetical protein